MSYRPITDFWFLARPKVKYYGAYPAGFLERARVLLGDRLQPMLHVCGGRAKDYPNWSGLCPFDRTLDLDESLEPDYVTDARMGLPLDGGQLWAGMLVDPPYTPADADHYAPGKDYLPRPERLLSDCLEAVRPGGRVGFLHYYPVRPPSRMAVKFLACAAVCTGFGNRLRSYAVYERLG